MEIMDIHFIKTRLKRDPDTFEKFQLLVERNASDDEFEYLYDKGRLMSKLERVLR